MTDSSSSALHQSTRNLISAVDPGSFRAIKNGNLKNGISGSAGYLLADSHSVVRNTVAYTLTTCATERFAFVFGFRGMGCHYTCHINPPEGVISLYEIRDGIRIYLHHVRIVIPDRARIAIVWDAVSIRLRLDDFTLFQVLTQGPTSGFCGFAPLGKLFRLPVVTVEVREPRPFRWICLGDGFSNARWKTRDFMSWPELLFGESDTCLNACVGAGNTLRILEVIDQIKGALNGANMILSVGADDLIEGESIENYLLRLQSIINLLRSKKVSSIHIATLHPRASALEKIAHWSVEIRNLATRNQIGILDFHEWIVPDLAQYMIVGEYPGRHAQVFIAERAATVLGITRTHAAPLPFSADVELPGVWQKQVLRIHSKLKSLTREFPGSVD